MNATTNSTIKGIKTLIIHRGIFHADDVFAAAYVQIYRKHLGLPPVKIIRTFNVRDYMVLENGYLVADVGKGQYDHHFPEEKKERRDNNVPYAAFGLIVRDFHEGFLNETEYKLLDKKLIEPADYNDNYGGNNQLSYVIASFNKPWNSEDPEEDQYFFRALDVATTLLSTFIENNVRPFAMATEVAQNVTAEGKTIYLDKYAPIGDFFEEDENIEFIGSPSKRDTYQIVSVKDADNNCKKLFPKEIRGVSYPDGEFSEDGLSFCHSSGFMATFKDKETAKAFMQKYMEE